MYDNWNFTLLNFFIQFGKKQLQYCDPLNPTMRDLRIHISSPEYSVIHAHSIILFLLLLI